MQNPSFKQYDLEERTFNFAEDVRAFVKQIPRTIANIEDGKQVVRSSGSVGANYIEANEALSKKDFMLRIRIARKEAKESCFWLKLIYVKNAELKKEQARLIQEALELKKILSAICSK